MERSENKCFSYTLNHVEVHEAVLQYLEKKKVEIEKGKEILTGREVDGGISLTIHISTEQYTDI